MKTAKTVTVMVMMLEVGKKRMRIMMIDRNQEVKRGL
ncbi:hypothetical protein FOMG_08925 [Fusarium oxysporum f. sp. melonis 26406]|jgi:hypothetical protein|uniref:Uncharacterized protein n=2 Tax=Fusarium oxysporum TaxID=5507 RepID=W9HKB3_FUSOX|nr:hypothetical protein FOYG_15094 [Fusarium oxysporum NRRL 32931]EXK35716.1 hypothetical protein FOMG_08925 [Fusarium oxysporum f. sp. melonis 26406]